MLRQRTCTLVYLLEHERQILKSIIEDVELSPVTRRRAHALLLTDRVKHPTTTDGDVADQTGLCPGTIANIRRRYTVSGLAKAIKPLLNETDRIEMEMLDQANQSSYFVHIAARRRGNRQDGQLDCQRNSIK